MNKQTKPEVLVLSIALSTRGFGFALFENGDRLVDWGAKAVSGDKNAKCLVKIKHLLARYAPKLVVLEDHEVQGSRRSARTRKLNLSIKSLAAESKVKVRLLTRKKVMETYFADGGGTKFALAKVISVRFADELGSRMPPKRRAWMTEDYRMAMFNAVALGLAFFVQKNRMWE